MKSAPIDANKLLASRQRWIAAQPPSSARPKDMALEGGCGVIGAISSEPMEGRHLLRPLAQMNNRGNGKGGGVAVAGCFEDRWDQFALQIAILVPGMEESLEKDFVAPYFEILHKERLPHMNQYTDAGRLSIRPPEVMRFFVRVRHDVLKKFCDENDFPMGTQAEEEFVSRNSFAINKALYASGQPRAFVLSHGKNMMILKGVGFAEDIMRYYLLNEFRGKVWIGHQRYPTRGRVWHPGGAHPFSGMNEALVHNGDLANYQAIVQYLGQQAIEPLFFTDTEVAVLLFDLYNRTFAYPLEYIFEALAPTTARDFERLPKDKQRVYRAIRASHLHGSPDGPFFFILARTLPKQRQLQLIGITDTAMLRPQVFALHEGKVQLGLVASEKQAIDAYLQSASMADGRIAPQADTYWNARGGSHTDGGAFVFSLGQDGLRCEDKFGHAVGGPTQRLQPNYPIQIQSPDSPHVDGAKVGWATVLEAAGARAAFEQAAKRIKEWDFDQLAQSMSNVIQWSQEDFHNLEPALDFLTLLLDQRYNTGEKKPSSLRVMCESAIVSLLEKLPIVGSSQGQVSARLTRQSAGKLGPPPTGGRMLCIDARGFEPQGRHSVARLLVRAYRLGWRRLIVYACKGDRFIGCGLGPDSDSVRIDVYGSSGDYLGSGLDGAQIYVHGDAQDQVGQILKRGRIIVFGNVGQTLLYGAKGGEVFVRGNAAGRPLINAVGNVRVVINGTCLDYAAESFMAGATTGGGFLVINGVTTLDDGRVYGLETKYPGSNLFSLASGGCCYLNDPYQTVSPSQLNGARFDPFLQEDWNVLDSYLSLNQDLFRIHTRHDLLMVDGVLRWPKEVFRKVVPASAPEPVE